MSKKVLAPRLLREFHLPPPQRYTLVTPQCSLTMYCTCMDLFAAVTNLFCCTDHPGYVLDYCWQHIRSNIQFQCSHLGVLRTHLCQPSHHEGHLQKRRASIQSSVCCSSSDGVCFSGGCDSSDQRSAVAIIECVWGYTPLSTSILPVHI